MGAGERAGGEEEGDASGMSEGMTSRRERLEGV